MFILNASRRLFSDRFFTSSFHPECYSTLGLDWVKNNGPGPVRMEEGTLNGHRQKVSPLRRVSLRTMPEQTPELQACGQHVRPLGARPRRVLFAGVEAAVRCRSDEAFQDSAKK